MKKKHARGPNGRCAAKPGKDIPGNDRFDLKQQKSTQKNGQGVGHDSQHGQFSWRGSRQHHEITAMLGVKFGWNAAFLGVIFESSAWSELKRRGVSG